MANILLTTHGTTGDVLPMLRLAREFIRRGHRATFAVNPTQVERAERWGVPAAAVGPPFGPKNFATYGDSVTPDKRETTQMFAAQIEHMIKPFLGPAYRDFLPLVAGHDVVVYGRGALWAAPAGAARRKPYVSLSLSPLSFSSRFYPPGASYAGPLPFPGTLRNFLLWRARNTILWWGMSRRLHALYKQLGVPVAWKFFREDEPSPYANLLPIDPVWAPPPPDWPKTLVQTGFLLQTDEEVTPPAQEVRRFVERDDGRPLIVSALGSTSHAGLSKLYEQIVPVVRRRGWRLLIAEGWGEVEADEGDVLSVPYVPYVWLFKHAHVVMHHGGTGTSAECLRAGVPQIVVPYTGDQFDNAKRARRFGCGTVIKTSEFTPQRFEQELTEITNNLPELCRRAEELSGRVLPDGLGQCAAAVERVLEKAS